MSGIEMVGTVLTIALIVLLAWNYYATPNIREPEP